MVKMLRTRTYTAINPPVDSIDDEKDIRFQLTEERIENEQGRELSIITYTPEGDFSCKTLFTYDSKGNCTSIEEYAVEVDDQPDKRIVFTYNPDGKPESETIYYMGALSVLKQYEYNSYGMLSAAMTRELGKDEDDPDSDEYDYVMTVVYEYDLAAPQCCVKEEHTGCMVISPEEEECFNGLNIYRQWDTAVKPPFLLEMRIENNRVLEQSVVHRYYQPGTQANNVVEEMYNWKGELTREKRSIVNDDLPEKIAWHEDEIADSKELMTEEFEYNANGDVIKLTVTSPGEFIESHMQYDEKSRMVKKLVKTKYTGFYELLFEKKEYEMINEA